MKHSYKLLINTLLMVAILTLLVSCYKESDSDKQAPTTQTEPVNGTADDMDTDTTHDDDDANHEDDDDDAGHDDDDDGDDDDGEDDDGEDDDGDDDDDDV